MHDLNKETSYWNNRWQQQQTGWDMGHASPAIVEYMQQYNNKNATILIPGCGNAHEAEALVALGFSNITLLDIAPYVVEKLQNKFAETLAINVICDNFFNHKQQYDLIIEQTFFCAISPEARVSYVRQAYNLLKENGRIIGLLFDTEFEKQGPPFGGSFEEYQNIFSKDFKIKEMKACYNSIGPRAGTELFINFIKK